MKPICVSCHRFLKMKRAGLYFLEGMPSATGAKPGLEEPEKWRPYKLWSGDVWECPQCKNTIISGVGLHPIAEHFEPDFRESVDRFGAELQINDC